jgi:hypothetical protein
MNGDRAMMTSLSLLPLRWSGREARDRNPGEPDRPRGIGGRRGVPDAEQPVVREKEMRAVEVHGRFVPLSDICKRH